MELLYFWINQSNNGVFKKQEVLLTSKYNIRFDSCGRKIKISINESFFNIFESDSVKSVSALVGFNGAGKTTLLNYLYNNDINPKMKGNSALDDNRYLQNKTLQIFEQEKELIIIHNFEEDILEKNIESLDKVKIIRMDAEEFRKSDENESHLNTITKIYLTNGNYLSQDGYSLSEGNTSKVVLSSVSLRNFSNNFYRKCTGLTDRFLEETDYNILQAIIISEKTEMDFQSICDIIYCKYLFDNKLDGKFSSKIPIEFHIHSVILLPILSGSGKYKYESRLLEKLINRVDCDRHYIINSLKLNLICELSVIFGSDCISAILAKNSKEINLDDIYFSYKDKINLECEERPCEIEEYYINATEEIDELEKIIKKNKSVSNGLPKDDLAYKEKIIISHKKNKGEYFEFINYIDKIAKNDKSFILKYIEIDNLKMSSGERAYLNFFSWLNLLTFFNKIDQNIIESTNENILLLIDEIELYCHPEWQRKFVDFLIDDLNVQFKDKNIQIIFATHSPIVLSDIPLSNTIYISKDKNYNSVIENRVHHRETFGANIYTLFNDSFFLEKEGVIGEYAKSKINQVFLGLKKVIETGKGDEDLKQDEIKFIIDSIGEPVIKNKLEKMYIEVFSGTSEELINLQRNKIKKLEDEIIKNKNLKNLAHQLQNILEEINKLIDTEGDVK